MVVSVASYKGGVGKTVTAIHLAAYFHQLGATLLLDSDANRASVAWAAVGKLPFKVLPYKGGVRHIPNYQYVIVDTEARPEEGDMKELSEGCDLLVIPTSPDAISLRVLDQTLETMKTVKDANYRVLLTIVPPRPNKDGEAAREYLESEGVPLFRSSIRRIAAFARAALEGVTVDKVDRVSLGWRDYELVGEEIIELHRLQIPA
jgi:chromosome partitioning protein